jgi:hypothetical protein
MLSTPYIILLSIIIIAVNIYTIKHGFAMWKYEKNKLGAIGTWTASAASIAVSIFMLIQRM